jgi:hypothetical protein
MRDKPVERRYLSGNTLKSLGASKESIGALNAATAAHLPYINNSNMLACSAVPKRQGCALLARTTPSAHNKREIRNNSP